MRRYRLRISSLALVLASAAFAACGGVDSGSGAAGGGSDKCEADVDVTGCDVVVAPSDDDNTKVQTALIEVKSGSTMCFCPATYHFTQQLSLTVPNVTVRGAGKNVEDTVLDFKGTTTDATSDTMLVTADGFTIENLWVKNTPGNGVVVRQADSPTFRKLKVSWDGGSKAINGAYAVYPAECSNVLIEECDVEGAADAAIYVGQGTGAIVRNNKAHGSVLGIELENTTDGEVHDNEIYDNSGGLAVFLLGNLTKKTSQRSLLYNNNVHDNNHVNFGAPNTFVAAVPPGTGIIVVGADDVEIRDNIVKNNDSAGVLFVSYLLMTMLVPGATVDPETDPYPQGMFVHSNTYDNNGQAPHTPFDSIGIMKLENVLWDGIAPSGDPPSNDAKLCLGTMGPYPSFRMFAAENFGDTSKQSTDTTPYQCDLPAIPPQK